MQDPKCVIVEVARESDEAVVRATVSQHFHGATVVVSPRWYGSQLACMAALYGSSLTLQVLDSILPWPRTPGWFDCVINNEDAPLVAALRALRENTSRFLFKHLQSTCGPGGWEQEVQAFMTKHPNCRGNPLDWLCFPLYTKELYAKRYRMLHQLIVATTPHVLERWCTDFTANIVAYVTRYGFNAVLCVLWKKLPQECWDDMLEEQNMLTLACLVGNVDALDWFLTHCKHWTVSHYLEALESLAGHWRGLDFENKCLNIVFYALKALMVGSNDTRRRESVQHAVTEIQGMITSRIHFWERIPQIDFSL